MRAIAARAYRSSITREAVTARELMACAGADAAGTGEHGSGTAKAELDLGGDWVVSGDEPHGKEELRRDE